jgi:hypothetical protein
MEQFTHRLVIETAKNGFLVYVNQDLSQSTVRPSPYVFESMENLLIFVKKNFPDERSTAQVINEMYKKR